MKRRKVPTWAEELAASRELIRRGRAYKPADFAQQAARLGAPLGWDPVPDMEVEPLGVVVPVVCSLFRGKLWRGEILGFCADCGERVQHGPALREGVEKLCAPCALSRERGAV